MADLTVVEADVRLVSKVEAHTGPAREAIIAGQYCVYDPTTGHVELGDASAAGTARNGGVAINSANIAGITVTVLLQGEVDLGAALDGLGFGAPVFASDTTGALADVAGTATLQVGYVKPVYGSAAQVDRILHVGT